MSDIKAFEEWVECLKSTDVDIELRNFPVKQLFKPWKNLDLNTMIDLIETKVVTNPNSNNKYLIVESLLLYLRGDYKNASYRFYCLAEKGNALAQRYYGNMIEQNHPFIKSDAGLAIEWYKKSAKQGNCIAQYHVGLRYKQGSGVIRDIDKAIKWCTRSAEQGYDRSMMLLGIFYRYGIGNELPIDHVMAIKWYLKAAALSNDKARQSLSQLLSDYSNVAEFACYVQDLEDENKLLKGQQTQEPSFKFVIHMDGNANKN